VMRLRRIMTHLLEALLELPERLFLVRDFAVEAIELGIVVPSEVDVDVVHLQRRKPHPGMRKRGYLADG